MTPEQQQYETCKRLWLMFFSHFDERHGVDLVRDLLSLCHAKKTTT